MALIGWRLRVLGEICSRRRFKEESDYEAHADPGLMLNCHCRDCQQANGSAYAAALIVPKTTVEVRGEPRY